MEKAAIAMLTLLACILLPDTLGASLLSLQKDAERPSYINHTETVSCPSGAMVPLVVWVQPVSVTIGVVQQIKAIAVLNMKPAVRVDTSVTMLIVTASVSRAMVTWSMSQC